MPVGVFLNQTCMCVVEWHLVVCFRVSLVVCRLPTRRRCKTRTVKSCCGRRLSRNRVWRRNSENVSKQRSKPHFKL